MPPAGTLALRSRAMVLRPVSERSLESAAMPDSSRPGADPIAAQDPSDSALVARALQALARAGAADGADRLDGGLLDALSKCVEAVAGRYARGVHGAAGDRRADRSALELQAVSWLLASRSWGSG